MLSLYLITSNDAFPTTIKNKTASGVFQLMLLCYAARSGICAAREPYATIDEAINSMATIIIISGRPRRQPAHQPTFALHLRRRSSPKYGRSEERRVGKECRS